MKKKGRPINDERIDKILADTLKVSELIEILKKQPQNAVVGRVGHCGELHGMNKYDISLTKCYVTSDDWRNEYRRENIEIVEIHLADIGDSPD